MKELVRHVRLEALVGRPFELRLYDTGKMQGPHTILAYELTGPDGLVFEGADFRASPMHAIDSDATVRCLLGFLTLRPGDTDDEYFADYTDKQRAFCQTDAEALSRYAYDEDPDPLEDIDP